MRQRPVVRDGTIWSDCNTLLRGSTMILWPPSWQEALWAINPESWEQVRALKLNIVRLKVGLSDVGMTVAEQLPYIDQCVDHAEQNNLYALLGLTRTQPGTYDMADLVAFWTAVAPRYKDRTHVLYEMINEPDGGDPIEYTDQNIADLKFVYNIMRPAAPQTHIALWDFMAFGGADRVFETLQKWLEIDYSNESVVFHWYSSTMVSSVPTVKEQYPLFMTETSEAIGTDDVGIIAQCEDLQISWIHLSGRWAEQMIELQTLIDGLARQGYVWEADKEGRMATLVDGQSVTWGDLEPGTYEITEAVPAGWELDTVEFADPLPNGCRAVLNPGAILNLIFRNKQRASITVTKETDPSGSTQEFEITLVKV